MRTSTSRVKVPKKRLAEICRRNRIVRLSLFGSVLRDDFHKSSDVDILVEFESGYTPGLSFFRIQRELSKLIGREVDLRTFAALGPHISQRVLDTAEPQYVR